MENPEQDSRKRFQRLDFDIIIKHIGSAGKYQILLICLAYYIAIPSGMNQVASVFVAAIPKHRCKILEFDNLPGAYKNLTEEHLWELYIPVLDTNKYDECRRYIPVKNCTEEDLSNCFTNDTKACDAGYVYDRTEFESTIATEWNIVCDRLIWGTVSLMIYFAGVGISSVVGGNLSDRFGRTRVMLIAQLAMVGLGIGCSFSTSLIMFSALRFAIACCVIASWEASFVYMIEVIGNKWRTPVGISIQGVFAVGYILLSVMSYYLREWRSLQLGVAVASCVFPILWIFLPESPRWLLSKGEVEKGMKISDTIARRNGRKLPDDIWNQALIKDGNEMTEAHIYPHELFKRRLMKLITLRMMFIWFVCSLVYYGLSLNVGSLAGDTRINNALGGLCEILSCPLAIFTIDRFGRRPVLFIILIAAGLACIFSTAANYFSSADSALGVVGTIFALLGKLGISSAFAIIYNYTAELFPTVLRATAVGTGSMSARLGGICSPLVILIQYSLPWLPGVLFGALSLLAAAMCLYLPETKDARLTTTLEDAEIFYAKARNLANPKKSNNDCHEMEKLDENLM